MTKYLLTRLRQSLITLFLVSIVVFAGIRALPGDPALALAGEERSPEALAAIREAYGLNDNIVVQYGRFIGHALTGDLGTSSRTGLPVADAIGQPSPSRWSWPRSRCCSPWSSASAPVWSPPYGGGSPRSGSPTSSR